MRRLHRLFRVAVAGGLALVVMLLLVSPAAAATVQCRLGIYLVDLHDFSPPNRTYSADFWIWAVCPSKVVQPIANADFINSENIHTALESQSRAKGMYWTSEKVSGTFHYPWNLQNFPFDHHQLTIRIEDAQYTSQELEYLPDTRGSGYRPSMTLEGWTLTGFHLTRLHDRYASSFGNPLARPDAPQTYSELVLTLNLARSNNVAFLLLSGPAYIGMAIALISLFMPVDDAATRTALIAGALFTVVINLQTSSAQIGANVGVPLLGQIHFLTLVFVLIVSLVNIQSIFDVVHGGSIARAERLNLRAFAVLSSVYVVLNVVLIYIAIRMG